MQGYIFNTPFYSRRDWHTNMLILCRNGQKKGVGTPGTIEFDRRVTMGQAAHSTAISGKNIRGTTSFRGKKVGNFAMELRKNPLMHQSFGGAQAAEERRKAKIEATGLSLQRLAPLVGQGRGFSGARGYSEYEEF